MQHMEQLPIQPPRQGSLQRSQPAMPLTALVKSAISSIRSQSVSRTTTPEISRRSLALRKTYSVAQIAQAYTPDLQSEIAAVKDVYTLHIQKETPTLRMLEQAYGVEFASRVWIKTQLVVLNDFVGVKNKLEDCQINPLCDQILVEYGGLNLLEFCLFMARLRSGKYEQFYGSVDPMLIMKSLDEFMEDRRADINRNIIALEAEQRKREYEEHQKNVCSFEDYYNRLSDEEKAKCVFRPFILAQQKETQNTVQIEDEIQLDEP